MRVGAGRAKAYLRAQPAVRGAGGAPRVASASRGPMSGGGNASGAAPSRGAGRVLGANQAATTHAVSRTVAICLRGSPPIGSRGLGISGPRGAKGGGLGKPRGAAARQAVGAPPGSSRGASKGACEGAWPAILGGPTSAVVEERPRGSVTRAGSKGVCPSSLIGLARPRQEGAPRRSRRASLGVKGRPARPVGDGLRAPIGAKAPSCGRAAV